MDEHTATRDVTPTLVSGTEDERGSGGKPMSAIVRFSGILITRLVTGVVDDDPSGIATYSKAGATLGTSVLWTVPLTLPPMMVTRETRDRIVMPTIHVGMPSLSVESPISDSTLQVTPAPARPL